MSNLISLVVNATSVEHLENGELLYRDAEGNELTSPNADVIAAQKATIQAEEDALQYSRDRAAAYPSIQEQLDMQYWDSVNGTTTWADAIAAVKAANPKPE